MIFMKVHWENLKSDIEKYFFDESDGKGMNYDSLRTKRFLSNSIPISFKN